MAITITNSVSQSPAFSFGGGIKMQLMTYRILSGQTSGTVTADNLKEVYAVMLDGNVKLSAAETYSGNVATLAFVVPAETAASRTFQSSMTVTAVADQGQDGNSITLTFTGGATAGSEVVTVSGTAITIQVEDGVSTATQVKAKYDAKAAAVALATMALESGHETDTVAAATVLPLQGGVTGGARGSCMAFGK